MTYNKHPLYTFALDKRAGQTKGQGSSNFGAKWYAVSARGGQSSRHRPPRPPTPPPPRRRRHQPIPTRRHASSRAAPVIALAQTIAKQLGLIGVGGPE